MRAMVTGAGVAASWVASSKARDSSAKENPYVVNRRATGRRFGRRRQHRSRGSRGTRERARLRRAELPGFDVGITVGDQAGNPGDVGPRAVALAGSMEVTLENMETGTTYSVRTAGALRTSPGPDGSTTATVTGPSILFLFPTDPGGPATTLYQGRLVFDQSADGVTTVMSSTGGTVDLCAALGG